MLFSKKSLLLAGLAVWLAVASWGMKGLVDYSFRPGEAGTAAERWPDRTTLPFARDSHTFVVALHPECPCSRATVAQLEQIIEQARGGLSIVAVFDDRAAEVSAEDSALFERLRTRGSVQIVSDRDGSEMNRFQFRTSGETRLYSPDGVLVFQGGITASRGHEGDNPGQAAVLAAIRGESRGTVALRMPVFGCSLRCE